MLNNKEGECFLILWIPLLMESSSLPWLGRLTTLGGFIALKALMLHCRAGTLMMWAGAVAIHSFWVLLDFGNTPANTPPGLSQKMEALCRIPFPLTPCMSLIYSRSTTYVYVFHRWPVFLSGFLFLPFLIQHTHSHPQNQTSMAPSLWKRSSWLLLLNTTLVHWQ